MDKVVYNAVPHAGTDHIGKTEHPGPDAEEVGISTDQSLAGEFAGTIEVDGEQRAVVFVEDGGGSIAIDTGAGGEE